MNRATEEPTSPDANPGENPVKEAKDDYLQRVTERSETVIEPVLDEFIEQFEFTSFEQIDRDLCRDYGGYLIRQVDRDDRDLSGRTAHTYYDYVRAFLTSCVKDGYLDTNPANQSDTAKFLPAIDTQVERQFWTTDQRETLIRYYRKQVDSALTPPKAPKEILHTRYRNRAIVTVLGLAAVRGAEVFAVTDDDRRDGITWDDVDIEGNTLTVRGKVSRDDREPFQKAQLPDRAARALSKWKQALDPPRDDWPVFPTNHYPSKRRALENEIGEERTDRLATPDTIDTLLREHDATPPSLSTNGARSILKRISERLAPLYDCIEYDEETNTYLKPHGARRGVGHELIRKGHSTVAMKSLRHESPEVTEEAYQDVKAKETAEDVDSILDDGTKGVQG